MLPPSQADIPKLYKQALDLQKAGDAPAALGLYERILSVVPGQAEVLFQVGRIRADQGDLAAAETALRAALAAKPKEPAIWQALYGVLDGVPKRKLEQQAVRERITIGSPSEAAPILERLSKGQTDGALNEAMALARAAPMAAAPVHAVGTAQAALGQWPNAVVAFEEALRRAPGNAQYLVDLCRAYARAGRPEAALARLAEAKAESGLANVVMLRARLLSDTCRDEDAVEVLKAANGSFDVRVALAMTQATLGQADAARATFGAAAKTSVERKRLGALRQSLAAALGEAGAVQAAIEVLTEALGRSPNDAALLTQRGQLRQTSGDLERAEADLTRAIELEPLAAEAYRAYANGRKTGAEDPIADVLAAQLQRAGLPGPTRRVMRFAAAKFAADRGDVTAEIDHLDRANRLMADAFPYSYEADLAIARDLASDWPKLEGLATDGPADPVVFVTGLPRSGTTLAETILAAHPQVTAGGEMPYLSRALAPALEALRNGEADATRFAEAGTRYLVAARRRTGAGAGTVIADKAISTFSRIGHAAAALPGARFVVMRRDPRDTGLSLWRNMFPEGLHRYAYDQVQMARYIRLHEALVAFWAARLPGRVHILDYEALTAEPEPVIRELIEFAELPWDDACLAPQAAQRSVATLSFAQVRQPIGRGSVAGWRRFEAGLGDLIAELERVEPPEL
jgi:tetratricopeptide (TPR) repeat protein